MSFEFQPADKTRLYYEPGATKVYKFPRGNLYAAMNWLLNLEVNVVTGAGENPPDQQIFRAIQNVSLLADGQTVWNLSGEMLAAYYTYHNGVAAAGNTTVAVTVANNVQAQHFLKLPFYPLDAQKPQDFLVDTRKHEYELVITWRDLTAAGVLFGTHALSGSVTATDAENYLDIELERLALRPNPFNGAPDNLDKKTPNVIGLRETTTDVTANNSGFSIDIPEFRNYRNLLLWTTHFANTNSEVGENDILNDKIKIFDTQGHIYQNRKASFVREDTAQRWGVGSNLFNGIYDINLTKFGAGTDPIVSNSTVKLLAEMSVAKQSNVTKVRALFVTQESQ